MYRAKRSRSVLAPSIVSAAKHRAAALARRGRSQQTNAPILIEAIR